MSQIILYPCVCTYIADAGAQDLNYGILNRMRVGQSGKGETQVLFRTLIHIDLSLIGAATIVNTSKLELYATAPSLGELDYYMYRITQTAWTEEGATWNKYDGVTNWAVAGGDYSPDTPPPVLSISLKTPGWQSWTGTTFAAFLQDAVDNRNKQLHLIIRWIDEGGQVEDFTEYESENATTAYRPKLTIDYTGGVVPIIATLDNKHLDHDYPMPINWTCIKKIGGEPVAHVSKVMGL